MIIDITQALFGILIAIVATVSLMAYAFTCLVREVISVGVAVALKIYRTRLDKKIDTTNRPLF